MFFLRLFPLFLLVISCIPALAQTPADTLTTASGLRYIWLLKAEGKKAKPGSKVEVAYLGRLQNGTLFEASLSGPVKITLGKGEVIKGWEEMLLLMTEGDKVEVFIPADLAYGSKGLVHPTEDDQFTILPDTPLIFELELVKVK